MATKSTPVYNKSFSLARSYLTTFMVFQDSLVLCCVAHKKNFARLILRSLGASENGQNLLTKMASEGVKHSDARISNTSAVKNLCLLYFSITPPDVILLTPFR